MTLSISARCDRTGDFGVIIASSSPAVAARCAYVRAGVGAACTQNITDPRLGPAMLDLLSIGKSAPDSIAEVVQREPLIAFRQITAIDANGLTAAYSGAETLGVYATATGRSVVAAGNLLSNRDVPGAMARAFESNPGVDLGDRLLDALAAGIAAGGVAGPVHSAGLLIAGNVSWPTTDLRVDWSEDPIAVLRDVWYVWKPQVADYLQRALDPGKAPSYGVPGDTG